MCRYRPTRAARVNLYSVLALALAIALGNAITPAAAQQAERAIVKTRDARRDAATTPGVNATTPSQSASAAPGPNEVAAPPPSLRVVKLLWKSQPTSAASALEKVLDQAIARQQTQDLRPHLLPLAERLAETLGDPSDPRWVAAVAALTLIDDTQAMAQLQRAVRDAAFGLPIGKREFLLRVWLQSDDATAVQYMHQALQLDISDSEAAWLEAVALRGLQSDRVETVDLLLQRWAHLPHRVQLVVIEPLSQQADSMQQLVDAIAQGSISKDLLNTNQLLKWSQNSDAKLGESIEKVWGKLRIAEDSDRKAIVASTYQLLSSGKSGRPAAGEQVFKRVCAQCHRLHGEGTEVGPDITSNGRGSFEQLVSNVMDPSLVIGTAFFARTVLTTDGQVLAGLVVAEDPQRLTLKVQGGKLVELDREDDIEEMKPSAKSLMPDGLEQQMKEQELLDLFAYLSLVRPLTDPANTTLPGTPPKLVREE